MNTLPFTDKELETIRYALYREAQEWRRDAGKIENDPPYVAHLLARADMYDDLAARMVQPEPDEWCWLDFSDSPPTIYSTAEIQKQYWFKELDVFVYGPFSKREYAQIEIDAFLHDDDPPQVWYWVYGLGVGVWEVVRTDEIGDDAFDEGPDFTRIDELIGPFSKNTKARDFAFGMTIAGA